MPGPELDLKRELIEAGNRLLRPPDEVDELLGLLDRVEHCLSFVEQQPAEGIQDALCPTFKALISNQLLKHPDTDVRVGVTACLTEISRITAPDVPYNDDVMKEVFKLTISSFEGLSDNSSKSFSKRLSILEIVARVRSAAVLLDLECSDLVVEMLQSFYKCIRDFHPDNVLASMESIMSLIIEESEEISTDLLFALFSVLRKDNKDALPIARKLGEKVVQNCATTLKPYIIEGVKSLKINLLDYDFVVTAACQVTKDHNPHLDNVLSAPKVNGSEPAAVVEDVAQEVVVASNGNGEVVEDATKEVLNTSNKTDSIPVEKTPVITMEKVQSTEDASTSDIAINPEPASEKVVKKRGRKPKIAKQIARESDSSKLPQIDIKESSEVNVHTEPPNEAPEDSSVAPNVAENKSDSSNKCSLPKAMVNDSLGSPSQHASLPGKKSSKRNRKSKKTTSSHDKTLAHRNVVDVTPDGLGGTEIRLVCSEKDPPDGVVDASSKSISSVEVKKERDNEGESEDTPLMQSHMKLGVTDGTPRTKKRGRPRKDASMSVATEAKDRVSSEGTSKKRSRQRSTPAEDGKEYGEEIVGLKIQVYWPIDKEFYDGIVESFDPVKRKHQILYTDNEREVLNLCKQKWNFVKSSEGSEKNDEACHANRVDSSDIQQNNTSKMDSDSVGKMENTGTPKRRGRPRKSAIALASAGKDTKSEDETNAGASKVDSMADGGNPVKSVESPSNVLPNLNDMFEDTREEKEVPQNDGTQTGNCSTFVGLVVNVTPKEATLGIDINETLAPVSDENRILDETTTPKSGNVDVNVTEEVKSGPGGSKTDGLNKNNSASDTAKRPRKRKVKTSSNSGSPAVLASPDISVKRRRGRPSKQSVETTDKKSEIVQKQLGDSKIDESRSGGHSDSLLVPNSEDILVEGQSRPDVNTEPKINEHGVPDKNVTNSTDSVMKGTNTDVALEKISRKSTSGELEFSSSPRRKLELKVSDTEPKLVRKRARKTTGSSSEKVKTDGTVKRPRGRPIKPKVIDPKSDISFGNGSGSSLVFKNDIADVVTKAKLVSTHTEAVDLKLGSAVESKGDDVSVKSPESEVSKDNLTSGSSKEKESETTTTHDNEEKLRTTRSKKPKGDELLLS